MSTTDEDGPEITISMVFVVFIQYMRRPESSTNTYHTYNTNTYNTYKTSTYNTYNTNTYNTYNTNTYNTYNTNTYNTYNTNNTYDVYNTDYHEPEITIYCIRYIRTTYGKTNM